MTAEARRRRAFREFVKENHPDRGGDPAIFAAGVEAFRAGPAVTTAYRDRWYLGIAGWVNRRIQRRFHPRVR
ncbi:hypothetical protein [Fodinicola acaciae]|uniref:hypothetical protein n=1 Tax=Fodinicola acaciae TaxID=2681555 RepID=UPI0013D2CFB3|nr:hypothetical protein [Fodinicola acaciae]